MVSSVPIAKTPRSKDFQRNEDIDLAKVWGAITNDPDKGANQTKGNFWGRVWDMFVGLCRNHHNRNVNTICAWWNNIVKPKCVAYVGCQRKAYKKMASGENHQNVIENANVFYEEQYGSVFGFNYVLKLVHDLPIFNYLIEEIVSTQSMHVESNIFSQGSESSPTDFPSASQRLECGKKQTKEHKRKAAMQSAKSRWESANAMSEGIRKELTFSREFMRSNGDSLKEKADRYIELKRIEIEREAMQTDLKMETERLAAIREKIDIEKLEAEKHAIEYQIMFQDDTNLTPFQLDYLRTRQYEISHKLGLKDPRYYD